MNLIIFYVLGTLSPTEAPTEQTRTPTLRTIQPTNMPTIEGAQPTRFPGQPTLPPAVLPLIPPTINGGKPGKGKGKGGKKGRRPRKGKGRRGTSKNPPRNGGILKYVIYIFIIHKYIYNLSIQYILSRHYTIWKTTRFW